MTATEPLILEHRFARADGRRATLVYESAGPGDYVIRHLAPDEEAAVWRLDAVAAARDRWRKLTATLAREGYRRVV